MGCLLQTVDNQVHLDDLVDAVRRFNGDVRGREGWIDRHEPLEPGLSASLKRFGSQLCRSTERYFGSSRNGWRSIDVPRIGPQVEPLFNTWFVYHPGRSVSHVHVYSRPFEPAETYGEGTVLGTVARYFAKKEGVHFSDKEGIFCAPASLSSEVGIHNGWGGSVNHRQAVFWAPVQTDNCSTFVKDFGEATLAVTKASFGLYSVLLREYCDSVRTETKTGEPGYMPELVRSRALYFPETSIFG